MNHYLSIVRDERREDGVEGRMFLDGKRFADTLEREAVMIPHGVWPIVRHESPKFGRPTLLIKCDRGYTLIHGGSRPGHSLGCVLAGEDEDGPRLSGSGPLVAWLEAHVLASLAAGDTWHAIVHEVGGDVFDGVLT